MLSDYPIAATGIYAVMPQWLLVPPRVRAFADFLERHFGGNSMWKHGLSL